MKTMMIMRCKQIGLCVLVLLMMSSAALAQNITGSIVGTVKDSSGAVIANATVTITNTEKNAVLRTVKTNGQGGFSAPLLPIGTYSVTVEAPEFKKAVRTGVMLNVNDQLTIPVTLQVGSSAQQVSVEATGLQVELQTAGQSGLINGTQVSQLNLSTRNYEQLVSLMPGVTSASSDELYLGVSNPFGSTNVVNFQINGGRTSQNNWTVDGADNVDRGANLTLLTFPSVDAISEFKVQRSNYDAEFGRAGAGQISVVTKSGNNDFHGDIYEFFRNDVLNANNWFNNFNNIPRKPLRYNDFGGTFGGPIFKGHTFFFFSEEANRVITYGTANAIVPTPAELAGNFPTPVCVAFAASGSCATTGTTITNMDPVAQAYIKDIFSKIPAPNGVGNSLTSPLRSIFNHHQELIRVDQIFSPTLTVFGRYLHDAIPTVEAGGLFRNSPIPGVSNTSTNSPGWSLDLHAIKTFSSTLVNEVGYNFSYGAIISSTTGLISAANSPDILAAITAAGNQGLPFKSTITRVPTLNFSGGSGLIGFGPYGDFNRNHNAFDNLSKVIGRHTMRFGASYNHYQKTENAGDGNQGIFGFLNTGRPKGTLSFTQAFANFLQGRAGSFAQQALDVTPNVLAQQIEVYAQDQFRIRPNLTLDFGVRYSNYRQPSDGNHFAVNFDPKRYNPAAAPAIDPVTGLINTTVTPPGSFDPLNGIIVGGKNSPFGGKISNENNTNFAPRIGVAWDPFSDGKTSIRAGYGVFYDPYLFGIFEQNSFADPPIVNSANFSCGGGVCPTFSSPTAGAAPALGPPQLHTTPLPNHTPYVQQWSLDVQKELARNLLLDVGYFGSKGTHLPGIVDTNQPLPFAYEGAPLNLPLGSINNNTTQSLNAVRPFLGYDAMNAIETQFNSNYHSLQTQLQKRFNGGSLLSFSYTFSKNLTNSQTDRSNAPQNTRDPAAEYGPGQFDRKHVFTANYVYDLPFFQSQQGFIGHTLGGWELSGITTFETGTPLTVFTFADADPLGLGCDGNSFCSLRPNQVGDPNAGAPHTISQWFNPNAFVDVSPTQTFAGTEKRGAARGPGLERWDIGVYKNIKITERVNTQFRFETFNTFNHFNPNNPASTTMGSGVFNKITTAHDPRILQLGLKVNF